MTCKKHPNAIIRTYKHGTCCMECERIRQRQRGEFDRVKVFVKRMGWLEGLEK